jgi:hypothetical protein
VWLISPRARHFWIQSVKFLYAHNVVT